MIRLTLMQSHFNAMQVKFQDHPFPRDHERMQIKLKKTKKNDCIIGKVSLRRKLWMVE